MGRYDNSLVAFISELFLSIVIVFSPIVLNAQGSADTGDDDYVKQFEINYNFETNVYYNYTYNEQTHVTRKFDNGGETKYTRDLTYWITLFSPERRKDGILHVKVQVDSLEYTLADMLDTTYYHSLSETLPPPFNNKDYAFHSIPLGMEYEITYSPYGEIANIESQMVDERRKQINDSVQGIKDPYWHQIWTIALSDQNLQFLADPQKNLLPDVLVTKDTLWQTSVINNYDGITLRDTVEVGITLFTPRNFILTAHSKRINMPGGEYPLYGVESLSKLTGISGTSDYKLKVTPRGHLNELIITNDVEMDFELGKNTFTQDVKTTHTWTLTRMYGH